MQKLLTIEIIQEVGWVGASRTRQQGARTKDEGRTGSRHNQNGDLAGVKS